VPVQGKESRRCLSGSHEKIVVRKSDVRFPQKGDLAISIHHLQIAGCDEDGLIVHSMESTTINVPER
jgi:hypothetical protein